MNLATDDRFVVIGEPDIRQVEVIHQAREALTFPAAKGDAPGLAFLVEKEKILQAGTLLRPISLRQRNALGSCCRLSL
jgi:hypothetical protein